MTDNKTERDRLITGLGSDDPIEFEAAWRMVSASMPVDLISDELIDQMLNDPEIQAMANNVPDEAVARMRAAFNRAAGDKASRLIAPDKLTLGTVMHQVVTTLGGVLQTAAKIGADQDLVQGLLGVEELVPNDGRMFFLAKICQERGTNDRDVVKSLAQLINKQTVTANLGQQSAFRAARKD